MLDVFLNHAIPHFLRPRLFLNLELISSASLTGHQTPGIKLTLPYLVLGLQKCEATPSFIHKGWGPEVRHVS